MKLLLLSLLLATALAAPRGSRNRPKPAAAPDTYTSSEPKRLDYVVIFNPINCSSRHASTKAWLSASAPHLAGATLIPHYPPQPKTLDLLAPPFPIVDVPPSRNVSTLALSRFLSHIHLWRLLHTQLFSAALVLTPPTVLTPALTAALEETLAAADPADWHIALLDGPGPAAEGAGKGVARRLEAGVGAVAGAMEAYVVTPKGVRWLLARVTRFAVPMEEEIAALAGRFPAGMTALGVCVRGEDGGCVANVERRGEGEVEKACVLGDDREESSLLSGRFPRTCDTFATPGGEASLLGF